VFKDIGDLLRQKAAEYRATHGVQPSSRKGAKQRITKLQRAIAALEDQDLLTRVAADLEDKYSADYVQAVINKLRDEINRLEAIVNWQAVAQPVAQPPPQPSAVKQSQQIAKKAKGYGLLSGLGYGYFY
jgi:NAD(P)-dependent dehydrogenase (short-subunit alcohol dehydrogenase family)